jgi:hypothetical protein
MLESVQLAKLVCQKQQATSGRTVPGAVSSQSMNQYILGDAEQETAQPELKKENLCSVYLQLEALYDEMSWFYFE